MKAECGSRIDVCIGSTGVSMIRWPIGSVPPSGTKTRWRASLLTYVFGGVAVSITFTQGMGLMAAKYSAAARTSSSDTALAIGAMRSFSFRAPLLKYFIWRTMYSAGRPAISADSGWPWPDMRWQVPHVAPGGAFGPLAIWGAGGCSSGNQSGGFVVLRTC